MAIFSVTRLSLASLRSLATLALHKLRRRRRPKKTKSSKDSYLGVSKLVLWMVTVWTDSASMHAYTSGAEQGSPK